MGTARPVLTVPFHGVYGSVGEKVLVAWNKTREATRAVYDAMPILQAAKSVILLEARTPDAGSMGAADFQDQLKRRGVTAELKHDVASEADVGEKLLAAARQNDADLLVMGAYGHSRVRDIVFGGASRHVLRYMSVPVLMSH